MPNELPPDAFGCRTLLVSYGTWAVSHAYPPRAPPHRVGPMGLDQYAAKVGETMQLLAQVRARRGVRTGWMSVQPHPLSDGTCGHPGKKAARVPYDLRNASNCPKQPKRVYYGSVNCPLQTDWRFPHVLAALNHAAKQSAMREGVEYLDTWPLTFSLSELAADGAHFTDGPVPPALTRAVYEWATTPRA